MREDGKDGDMDYEVAYVISKDAVDEAVFRDRALLDAYNEMIGSGDGAFVDRVQEPVFDLENAAREAAEAEWSEEAASRGARRVAEEGAAEVVAHLRACAAEAGVLVEGGPVTAADVARGFLVGAVRLGFAPGSGAGTVCRIGGNWFYFDTPEADDMDPGEYAASHDMTATCGLIAEAMSGLDGDERAYYRAVLAEAGCLG